MPASFKARKMSKKMGGSFAKTDIKFKNIKIQKKFKNRPHGV